MVVYRRPFKNWQSSWILFNNGEKTFVQFLWFLYGVLQDNRGALCEVSDLTPKYQPPSIFRTKISGQLNEYELSCVPN